jgi:hypothetical protein
MARKKSRPKATSRKQRAHSPSRRKALKGIAAYIGDKAVGGVIGNAAAVALGAVMGQLTASGKNAVACTGAADHYTHHPGHRETGRNNHDLRPGLRCDTRKGHLHARRRRRQRRGGRRLN